MVFACCFGGGGVDVDVQRRPSGYGGSVEKPAGKAQDFSELPSELPSGGTTKTGATFLSGNTASLSAVTSTDSSSVAYQLNILNSALAGLSGNWYERVSSASARLVKVSGAALCSVSILDATHDKFTVVHVTGKDSECSSISPIGSQLPALQAVASATHHQPMANGTPELRYNSVQVLQLLHTPLLYSFSDPIHGSREMKQPPYDWQALYGSRGYLDFCALPLMHEKSVVGAVTLVFSPPPPAAAPGRPPSLLLGGHHHHHGGSGGGPGGPLAQHGPGHGGGAPGTTAHLMCCDEQSMRTLGLLLSVLLAGQDVRLAQQVAEIVGGVQAARNLQQVVAATSGGAGRMLQLKTRVAVNVTLALLPGAAAAPGGGPLAAHSLCDTASSASSGGGERMRAIIFEELGGAAATAGSSGGGGAVGPRSVTSGSDAYASGSLGHQQGLRGRLQRANANAPSDAAAGLTAAAVAGASNSHGLVPLGRLGGVGGGIMPPGVRVPGLGAASASHDGLSGMNGSNGSLLWQASLVQARALGLRHTLLANLPSGGTVVHDCASYMQQVGCPKRDLYLLSACNGAPPHSLVIAPAPLQLQRAGSETGGSATDVGVAAAAGADQLVLYVAVAMRLPHELLSEVLAQAQQLAVRVLAPLLGQKLAQGGLAEELALLLGKCSAVSRGGGAAAEAAAAETQANSSAQSGVPGGAGETAAEGGGTAGGGDDTAAAAAPPPPLVDAVTGTSQTAAGAAANGGANGGGGGGSMSLDQFASAEPPTPASAAASASEPVVAISSTCPARAGSSAASPAGGASASLADAGTGTAPSRVLSAMDTSRDSQASRATVLSTAVAGTFAGDTRTHMGMLVSSFKDTINALQAFRAEEAEELSVLKLGKVLGRGGSGLVFQGYLHMGLEVAVKLFENPDDTDTEAVVSENGARATATALSLEGDGSSIGTGGEAAAAAAAPAADCGAGSAATRALRRTASRTAAAQMTKRQRDLLRNALELGVTSSLSHPNVVQGYCHWVNVVLMQDASLNRCWLMGQAEYLALAPPGSPPPPLCSALVMEYCDMGSLVHALKRGTFSTSSENNKPNMEFVYMCLLEIALALRHLHTAKLAHCDLKPGNVLLRSSPRDPRGFVCKLGDFGYAAILKDGLLPGRPAVLPEEACGTLQYMAPELFVAGRPVDASIDIYAFGMLMWELITGRTPYSEGDYPSRSLMKAVYHGKRPAFPESTLSAYKNLAMCCWSGDPNMRPSAAVLVKLLRQQLESYKQHSSTASSTSTVGSRA